MSWTKRQFVEEAFAEIGLAAYAYDLSAEQLQTGLRRLDGMMAMWNGKGIRIGYPLPGSPDGSNLDDDTGVPDHANEAIYKNLAVRIAPLFGKQILTETKVDAKNAYNLLLQKAAMPGEMVFPDTLPAGAGNKAWRADGDVFMEPKDDNVVLGPENEAEFI